MSIDKKALMTHYLEGSIICRELETMMNNSAAEARFDRELAEESELYRKRHLDTPYGGA